MMPEGLTALADVERPSNPFPGLRPFEFGESHLYFGRDGQSDQLIRKLAATRFVAVVGTSGSGKSSLVRAGLLPDLFSGFMAGAGSHWRVALMRPGNDPLGNLAGALCSTEVFGSDDKENAALQTVITEATLRRGGLGLVEAVRQNRMASNESLLVVVDQFEELFRFARVAASEQYRYEAAAFVKLLLEAARQRELNVYVVLTMRSDFLGDCSIFWDLPEAINEGQFLIPRMTRDQRAEAITGPIAVCGGRIEQRLVNRLLNDTGDNPDLLPILQHALMRTWENWAADHAAGEAVDLRHYEAVGTMSAALSRHADEAYNELSNERSKQIAERVFKALTEKGEDNREVRRPTVLRDLCALVGASVSEVVPVLEVFRREGRSFLMPPAAVPLEEESLIDISHESLIRNWERLKGWVDEESQSAQIYTRLAETAVLHERGQAGLWRDPDLQLALDWRERTRPTAAWGARYHPSFDASMKFLDASVHARDAAALEEERRRRREIRRTRVAAVIFFLLFMLSLAALTYANVKRNEAQEKSDAAVKALSRAEQANARAEAALAEAVRERDRANEQTDAARRSEEVAQTAKDDALKEKKAAEEAKAEAVKSAEAAHRNEVAAVAAKAVASKAEANAQLSELNARAEARHSLRLLYASDMTLAQQAYDAGNIALGHRLLDAHRPASGPDKNAGDAPGFEFFYLWNLFNREKESYDVGGRVLNISQSPAGNFVAVKQQGVALLDAATRAVRFEVTSGEVNAVAISPDGKALAFAETGSNTVELSVEGGASAYLENKAEVSSLAFSPDGKTLAVGTTLAPGDDSKSEVALWDVASRTRKQSFESDSLVTSVAFSPDGKMLAVGGHGSNARVLDAATGEHVCTFSDGWPPVSTFVFSADGHWLAVGSQGEVYLREIALCGYGPRVRGLWPLALRQLGRDSVEAVAFSPDSGMLAASFSDNTIELYDVPSHTQQAVLKGHEGVIKSVAFMPDSRTLITGGEDGTVKLWDTAALILEHTQAGAHTSGVNAVAFSPDGKRLASGSVDKRLYVWDAAKALHRLAAVEYGESVYAAAFSPDGTLLATGAEKPPLRLLDANTYQEVGPPFMQRERVLSVAFSNDGRRLLTGGKDGVKLWDTASHSLLKEYASKPAVSVAFSPDGKTFAAGFADGLFSVWDGSRPEVSVGPVGRSAEITRIAFSPDGLTLAVAYEGGNVMVFPSGATEFDQGFALSGHKGPVRALAFSPDGRTLATGGDDGTIKLWAASTHKELMTIKAHNDPVMSLAFSPDGKALASASFDRTVRLWHAASAEKVAAAERR